MELFLNETEVFDNLFKCLKQMQVYLHDMKKLEVFNLPKPVCLQNAYMMNMYYLNKQWLDKFFYLNVTTIIYIIIYWLLIKIFKD